MGFPWLALKWGVTDAIPQPARSEFVPKLQQEQVVDITAVKARLNLSGVVLVDSRESDRYRGEREPLIKLPVTSWRGQPPPGGF